MPAPFRRLPSAAQKSAVIYKVNEIFDSLQGEGRYTGRPSTFVRLQGCAVACPWCDTKYTWSAGRPDSWRAIEAKTADSADDRCADVDSDTLVGKLKRRGARHVVITGGEPAMYDLLPLTSHLNLLGISSQVETSGTSDLRVHPAAWVTCSPKIGNPAGLTVRASVLQRANEIKMPVGKMRDVETLRAKVLPFVRSDASIYLQPLSCSPKATQLCIEQATMHGWSVSLQLHKYLELR
jgi:7-carboxy-7-deazaguanine synthase